MSLASANDPHLQAFLTEYHRRGIINLSLVLPPWQVLVQLDQRQPVQVAHHKESSEVGVSAHLRWACAGEAGEAGEAEAAAACSSQTEVS
jgi:hypothetical protein